MTVPSRRRAVAALSATAALALGLASLGAGAAQAAAVPAPPVNIDVLTFNDFHGRLEAGGASAGAAVLGGLFAQFRAANPNTIVAAAGDNVGASTFTSFVQNDQPTIDALNAAKVDVSALGNHEFDQGRADVDTRLTKAFGFPLISANLYDTTTQKPAYDPYYVKTVSGIRVGFIGATTEDLPTLVSPSGISTLDVKPVVDSVNRVAAQLRDGDPTNGEADVLVLAQHEGPASGALSSAQGDTVFGKIVAGVGANIDAIVAGHTHQVFDQDVPVPGTSKTIPVIEAGKYGESYGRLAIQVDPATRTIVSIDGEVKPLVGAAQPDPAIAKIVADAVAVAKEKGQVSLGSIASDITRARKADGSENRGGESTLSNLIADVQLAATTSRGAKVALMNPGGVRTDLLYAGTGPTDPDGNVTYSEAASVQPFSNTLVTLDLTGAQLKTVLEQQWQPGSSRPFLKLGVSKGLSYTYDPAAATGSHITSLALDGKPLAPTATVKIVTNSFLASGGDGFLELAKGANTADTGLVDLATFVDYLKANSPVKPDTAQRSIGVKLTPPAAAAGYAPGERVTASVSSMLFTNGGPTSGTAAVTFGTQTLGSAPLSFTVAAAEGDEQGAADVVFTMPKGVTGAQTLTITGPGGTAIPVPVTIAGQTGPVATTTTGYPDRVFASRGDRIRYTAQVTAADGTAPVGTVQVRDRGKAIAQARVAADGSATLTLPPLKRGVHFLTATFTDGKGFAPSTSRTSIVIVW
ncbi:MAG: 5'-nucleotidase C-terminal domain-containing protein [Micrococcales bacterium]|nr:5'-nucleotidase C-terminal domain-containing protein [Micrococcales bacterium]